MKKSMKSRIVAGIAAAGIATGALLTAAPAQGALNNADKIYYTNLAWCIHGANIEDDYEGWTSDFYKSKCMYDSKRGQYYRIIGYNVP